MAFLLGLRIHILPTKWDPSDIRRVEAAILVEGGLTVSYPAEADVVLTKLRGVKRVEMCVGREIMDSVAVVNDTWLDDSIQFRSKLKYNAYLISSNPLSVNDIAPTASSHHSLPTNSTSPTVSPQPNLTRPPLELHNSSETTVFSSQESPPLVRIPKRLHSLETTINQPISSPIPHKMTRLAILSSSPAPSSPQPHAPFDPAPSSSSSSSAQHAANPSQSMTPPNSPPCSPTALSALPTPATFTPFHPPTPNHLLPPPGPPIDPSSLPRFACQRRSPRICINQPLLDELSVIIRWKEAGEGDVGERGNEDKHSLAYKRGCAAIKSYPTKIQSKKEAAQLPFVGEKLAVLIDEYLKRGYISKAREIRLDLRLHALLLFQTLHGVGPTASRELYDAHHCRTLDDVFRVRPALANQGGEEWGEVMSKIPREEVEDIARTVWEELDGLEKGYEYTICGGYRRGKPTSNDVDILFTFPHPSPKPSSLVIPPLKATLDRLVCRLQKRRIVTSLMSGSHIGAGGKGRKETRLEQVFCTLRLPGKGSGGEEGWGRKRRVDLIFASYDVYYTAILGWSGSTMLERDIRRHANSLDPPLKFDSSGIVYLHSSLPIPPIDPAKGERGVFEALQLEYLEPWERCADI